MKICPRCNTQNNDNTTNCTYCGFNFVQTPQYQPIMAQQPPLQQPTPQPQIDLQSAYYYGMQAQKKKTRKKRWIIFGVVVGVLLFFALVVAGSSDSSNDVNSNDNIEKTTVNSGEATTQKNNAGSYNVEVKKATLTKDVSDNSIVVVTYLFTNNGTDSVSFDTVIDDKAFQNGVELGVVWSSYGVDDLDFETKSKEIKPGVTFEVTCAYELNDESTPVDIELYRYFKNEPFYKYKLTLK